MVSLKQMLLVVVSPFWFAGATDEPALPWAVGKPPETVVKNLGLSPVYVKHIDVNGFAILGSARVSDHAMREAAYLVSKVLENRPDVLKTLGQAKVRLVVMSPGERTTDVPEHSDLRPASYWDRRARGLGATPERPAISCAAENLLGLPGDPYRTENIMIHEFAHGIHLMALVKTDPGFADRLQAAYDQALKAGLWKGTYAATNVEEYWAEGVQSWFNCNRESDNQHNHVNTRAELDAYDPSLAKLILESLGSSPWFYQTIAQRDMSEKGHLAGFDVAAEGSFSWDRRDTVSVPDEGQDDLKADQ